MVRAVVDTNVLISALLQNGIPRKIWLAFKRGEFKLLISPLMFQEVVLVAARPKFHHVIKEIDRKEAALFIELFAEFIEPKKAIELSRDPDDNHILSCGLEADVIVSGDGDIYTLKDSFSVPIMKPREFLTWLESR